MQTSISENQRIIVVEGTDNPPLEDLASAVRQLGDGWSIKNATTTTETVMIHGFYQRRSYRRYTMTAVIEKAA